MVSAPAPTTPVRAVIRLRLRVRDNTFDVEPAGLLPIKDKIAVRAQTGLPYEAYLQGGSVGEDSLVVLWWLGRRQSEPALSFDQAVQQWPDDLTADDIDLEYVNVAGDVDRPE